MDNLRSICFVYEKKDAYNACYLKEFFKWIGFSYTDFLYNEKIDIFASPEKCHFDIIVNMNKALPETREQDLKKVLPAKFIPLDGTEEKTAQQRLQELLEQILERFAQEENCQLLQRLAEIYEEHHMVNILYAYTFLLLEKMDRTADETFRARCAGALNAVEAEIARCQVSSCKSSKGCFLEYALFAKYECQRKLNDLQLLRGRALEYDVEDFLNNIDEIYELDPDFYKVEYLKARAAEQDCRYAVYARFYQENCIERCRVDICKSYHYYGLAKWKANNRQPYEAEQYYRLSWEKDPSYVKAIFKLAVENAKTNRPKLAENFLQNIIDLWPDQGDRGMMAPMDIEYAYKVRIWMARLEKNSTWERKADSFLEFVRSLKTAENVKEYYFMKKMYPEQAELEKICDAMLNRIDIQCIG